MLYIKYIPIVRNKKFKYFREPLYVQGVSNLSSQTAKAVDSHIKRGKKDVKFVKKHLVTEFGANVSMNFFLPFNFHLLSKTEL